MENFKEFREKKTYFCSQMATEYQVLGIFELALDLHIFGATILIATEGVLIFILILVFRDLILWIRMQKLTLTQCLIHWLDVGQIPWH